MMTQVLQPVQGLRRSALMQSGVAIFHRMCGLTVEPAAERYWPQSFVRITVELQGREPWMLCLSVPRSSAPDLAARLSGFDVPYDSRDMESAMETLADTIARDLQLRLRRRGERLALLPAHVQRHEDGKPLLAVGDIVKQFTFESELGSLVLAVIRLSDEGC